MDVTLRIYAHSPNIANIQIYEFDIMFVVHQMVTFYISGIVITYLFIKCFNYDRILLCYFYDAIFNKFVITNVECLLTFGTPCITLNNGAKYS